MQSSFKSISLNKRKNGTLDLEELGHLYEYINKPKTLPELKEAMARVDENGDGVIDLHEFMDLMAMTGDLLDETRKVEMQAAFKFFAGGADGVIRKEQLMAQFRNLDVGLTDEEADALIRSADLTGNGEVALDEFCQVFLRDISGFEDDS